MLLNKSRSSGPPSAVVELCGQRIYKLACSIAFSCATHAAAAIGTKHPDERAGTRLVQPFSDGGSFSKARRADRSSCTVNGLAGAPGSDAPFLDVLLRDRREAGQTVQVGDDAGQHPEHAGAVERNVFRLGIGLRPQVHNDLVPALQAFQPRATLSECVQLAREVGSEVAMPPVRSRLITSLTKPPGDLASFFRAQKLVDPACAEPRGGRDLADRHP